MMKIKNITALEGVEGMHLERAEEGSEVEEGAGEEWEDMKRKDGIREEWEEEEEWGEEEDMKVWEEEVG